MTKLEIQAEALDRARNGEALTNIPAIIHGFMAKGLALEDIQPRVNVLTFHAWKALGRSVKRGEHGVKVLTFVPTKDKETGEVTGKRPWTSTVFHISQTAETNERPAKVECAYPDPGELAEDRWNETHY